MWHLETKEGCGNVDHDGPTMEMSGHDDIGSETQGKRESYSGSFCGVET